MNTRLQRRPFRNSGKVHGKRLQDLIGRRSQSGSRLARQGGGDDAVHRTSQSLGERLLRELHDALRSPGADRELAAVREVEETVRANSTGRPHMMIWSGLARNRSPSHIALCFFGRIVSSDEAIELTACRQRESQSEIASFWRLGPPILAIQKLPPRRKPIHTQQLRPRSQTTL